MKRVIDGINMRPRSSAAVLLVFVSTLASAETFIGPTTTTNRLLVATNSAIIIGATFGDFTNSTRVVLGDSQFTQSYFAPLENGAAYALAGPAELVFSNAALISYFQITNSAIHTQGVANDPIVLPIASNQTMRLFNVPAAVNASFSRPGAGSVSFTLEPNKPAEFTGPGSLALSSGVFPPYGKFVSYFIAENGFVIPNQQYVAGPSGSCTVMVERSFDLKMWSPVLLESSSEVASAFYRLRIQR